MKDPSPPQAFHRFNANDLGGKPIPIILVLCVCLPFLIVISMSDFNRHRPLPSPEMMRMPRPDSQRSLQASFQISVTVEIRSRNIQLENNFISVLYHFIRLCQTLSGSYPDLRKGNQMRKMCSILVTLFSILFYPVAGSLRADPTHIFLCLIPTHVIRLKSVKSHMD